ncbi:DUF1656 domain-containing protein [Novosphingopyxis sp. YJ-S2-01]|uniref:DUF1656 domain-containing protein n=1 Tax=Novosphingopyxis sp. YJ-S2-01 TaxID=2794021 RepID=UPI0018DC48F4|nr:DUF1656 domain-containing protein [Novosphingopyxis sp. YJ-S2-01]MBH9536592.1 DUF1656 domain-containing protein [Novosphingopyxis sp. YJ-S2-01]|tara:strand:+ start:487 stop:705 length:219 start_codon:yes stop_codon:yes gene_type:complete
MTTQWLIGDTVSISTIVPAVLGGLLLAGFLSWLLARLRLYRFIWNRPLFELALFLILTGAIVALFPNPVASG